MRFETLACVSFCGEARNEYCKKLETQKDEYGLEITAGLRDYNASQLGGILELTMVVTTHVRAVVAVWKSLSHDSYRIQWEFSVQSPWGKAFACSVVLRTGENKSGLLCTNLRCKVTPAPDVCRVRQGKPPW
jgi:hypothetical protein